MLSSSTIIIARRLNCSKYFFFLWFCSECAGANPRCAIAITVYIHLFEIILFLLCFIQELFLSFFFRNSRKNKFNIRPHFIVPTSVLSVWTRESYRRTQWRRYDFLLGGGKGFKVTLKNNDIFILL